ncbi:hypothetical protein KCP76_20085 [Salmonella enterica subsp. enterica serovar Weltevreden]|nr:hypothetical protein KCP76_20085 [Salmonella enterica subsp. enterica serovar Weltevreden]
MFYSAPSTDGLYLARHCHAPRVSVTVCCVGIAWYHEITNVTFGSGFSSSVNGGAGD